MGLFNLLFGKEKNTSLSYEEKYAWDGSDSMACPRCGEAMTKRYNYSAWWCNNCHAGLDDDEDDEDDNSEALSVYDAALIWMSNGKDEDYTFGYDEDELEAALK